MVGRRISGAKRDRLGGWGKRNVGDDKTVSVGNAVKQDICSGNAKLLGVNPKQIQRGRLGKPNVDVLMYRITTLKRHVDCQERERKYSDDKCPKRAARIAR